MAKSSLTEFQTRTTTPKGWPVLEWSGLKSERWRILKDATQEPLAAARAACWLAICSFIFFCISLDVGCAVWVATIQV